MLYSRYLLLLIPDDKSLTNILDSVGVLLYTDWGISAISISLQGSILVYSRYITSSNISQVTSFSYLSYPRLNKTNASSVMSASSTA